MPRRRRPPGWAVASALVALLVAGPLAALPLSFLTDPGAFGEIADSLLWEALRASVVLALGVGAGTLLLGGALAALVSFYDFPGRRWLDWALVLPLAMPAYVLVFVLLGQYDEASPLQSALRAVLGDGFQLPQVRSTAGAIVVLTLVLYPYVYVLGRGAYLEQSRDTMEAARTLGLSHGRAVARLAL
ncbi:MAG: ABC transporter permease, partial [Solirubrobacteraceae bacterium]